MFRPNRELDGHGSSNPSKRPRLNDNSPYHHHYQASYSSPPTIASNLQPSYHALAQFPSGYGLNAPFSNPLDQSAAGGDDDIDDLDENLRESLGLEKGFFRDIPSPNAPRQSLPRQHQSWQSTIMIDDTPRKSTIRMPTGRATLPPLLPQPQKRSHDVVDLTADDDDDLILVSENKLPQAVNLPYMPVRPAGPIIPNGGVTDKVIYGTLRNLQVDMYCVPHPKEGSQFTMDQNGNPIWPAIPVTFNKPPPNGTQTIIGVNDGKNIQFGYLTEDSAEIIMGLWNSGFDDIEAWVYQRPHRHGEKPEDITSGLARVFCNVYGRTNDAKRVAKIVTNRNMRLDMPTRGFAKSVRYINPHGVVAQEYKAAQEHRNALNMPFAGTSIAPRGPVAFNPVFKKEPTFHHSEYRPVQTSYHSFQARGEDDIKQDVQKIFDDLEATENLPELDGNALIKTELIKHQKQGLYFMTEHEKPRRWKEDGTEANGLWKRIEKRKGSGRYEYRHLITNEVYENEPPVAKGGMLADMMGLGKTLQILSLITGSLNTAQEFADGPRLPSSYEPKSLTEEEPRPPILKSKGTLLIAPLSTITNWEEQIQAHIVPKGISYLIWHGSNRSRDAEEVAKYDVVITTYSLVGIEYRAHLKDRDKNFGPLQQIKWFRIVLDEAHTIREAKASLSKATISLSAERRWAVTGTPIQNRLDDFYSLLKFLQFNPFDQKSTFMRHIHTPIKNGDERVLPSLRALVHAMCIRRLKDKIDLPPREDLIEFVKFDPIEQQLHDVTMAQSAKKIESVIASKNLGGSSYIGVLQMIMRLRLICAHGRELLGDEDFSEFEGTSTADAIDIDNPVPKPAMTQKKAFQIYRLMQETNEDICFNCRDKCASNASMAAAATAGFDVSSDDDEDVKPKAKGKKIKKEGKKKAKDEAKAEGEAIDDAFGGFLTPCAHLFCKECLPKYASSASRNLDCPIKPGERYICPVCQQYQSYEIKEINLNEIAQAEVEEQKRKKGKKQIYNYNGPSPKVKALIQALHKNRADSNYEKNDIIKSIVFSSWTTHLDLIAMALEKEGIVFVRLDGSMTRTKRTESMRLLREDPKVEVMLVSLMAGGLGLNLTSASRVYMMEPHYNPAAEAQAVDRIHRLGQKRPVKCVRFIMQDSFELKILDLQKKKTELANLTFSHGKKLSKEQMSKQKLEELKSLFK